jgi:hypothetical protein
MGNEEIPHSAGIEIRNLLNQNLNPGSYFVNFNGENLNSGIYFYRLNFNSSKVTFSETKKLILLK